MSWCWCPCQTPTLNGSARRWPASLTSSEHIEARQLLVLQGQLSGAPSPGDPEPEDHPSPSRVHSAQKADHALPHEPANLSEYFLMLDGQVGKPRVISTIYWTLSAWSCLG